MIPPPIHYSEDIKTLYITSMAFESQTYIPVEYTCDGKNINPPITVKNIPEETKSLVLIVEDPDAPTKNWVHWVVWNIPPSGKIKENSIPGTEGINDFGKHHYGGPCPPSGTHHYHFKIYALDDLLNLDSGATKQEVEKAMSSHIIAFGELVGIYRRAL